MVGLTRLLPSLTLFTSALAASSVIDLIPSNFDSVVLKSGKPALVEFFAPWCGHCKTLAPVYEELGQAFASFGDKISIAKVDADEHRDLGKRFGVQGFPTLKWFDGKSDKPVDYSGGRDLESLTKWVTEKTGIKPKGAKRAAPSQVTMLDDASFKTKVGKDQNVLVAFTAPWCGHCKSLAPTWEKVATDFALEPNVLVAKVDADSAGSKRTAEEYGVKSYPTIKYFPAGSTEGVAYEGGRSEKDFVAFLNEQAGTHRAVGGGLDITGGTIAALDAVVEKYVGKDLAEGAADVKTAAEGLKDKYAAYYVKVWEKAAANKEYAEKELKRLQGLIKKGGLAPEKLDDLTSRSNILRKFKADVEGKDEL